MTSRPLLSLFTLVISISGITLVVSDEDNTSTVQSEDSATTEDSFLFDVNVIKVAETSNFFALKLYKEIALQNRTSAFAPFSLFTVLSALDVGSENQTAEELYRTLGYGLNNLTEPELLEGFREISLRLREGGLRLANGLWVRDSVHLHSEFQQSVEKYFHANISTFNQSPEAQVAINDWAKNVTEGHIPNLLKTPPEDAARILLLSAIYFKGVWSTRFDPAHTFHGYFRRNLNTSVSVSMMSVQDRFRYAHNPQLGAKILEMPFSGNEVSMLLVLPDSSLSEVEGRLEADVLFHAVDNMKEYPVVVTLPKFQLKGSLELRKALQSVGIHRAFGSGAQLGRMTADREEDLFVSEVMHQAVVEVDEQGAQAAGVSGLGITSKRGSKFETFFVDRPFMFFIGHIPSGLILFMGRVENLP